MSVSSDEFKQAMQQWASGVSLVTAQGQDGPQGMTATSFTSVCADPAQVLVCVNRDTGTAQAIRDSGAFGVSLLDQTQEALSNLFASPTPPAERFAAAEWITRETGAPLLDQALAQFDCRLLECIDATTHWIVRGEVVAVAVESRAPLLYCQAGYRRLR